MSSPTEQGNVPWIVLDQIHTTAKEAYGVYASRAGLTEPWEHLPVRQQQAWLGVVEHLVPILPTPRPWQPASGRAASGGAA